MMKTSLTILLLLIYFNSMSQTLTNTTDLSVTKVWYQEEEGYTYPTFVSIPTDIEMPVDGYPVCILLHGNGGNGEAMLNGNRQKFPDHILVSISGYEKSWNMSDERSDAPDIEMIKELVEKIQTYDNVDPNKIRFFGSSNGGGLCNRIFIEVDNPGIDIVCSSVSQLNNMQFREGQFYEPTKNTGKRFENLGYNTVIVPQKNRRYLGITNENDPLIPYVGGASSVGVTFLHSQYAAFLIAQSQGYEGEQLPEEGTDIGNNLEEYSYLEGQVIHLKGQNKHGSHWSVSNYIREYFQKEFIYDNENNDDSDKVTSIENDKKDSMLYPNPFKETITLKISKSFHRGHVEIFTSNGQKIKNIALKKQSTNVISVENENLGIYILRVFLDNKEVETHRLMKE